MKAKRIVSVVLFVFVGFSVGYLVVQESTSPRVPQDGQAVIAAAGSGDGARSETAPASETGHRLVVYYFHRTQRCQTCLTMEAYAEEALRDAFPDALASGVLEWHTANLEAPGNEHFVADYEVSTSAVVMMTRVDGRQTAWRDLDRVWDLVGDELKFKTYIETEAMMLLETGP